MQYTIALTILNRDLSVALRVRRYFQMKQGASIAIEMRRMKLYQADLVLALLRIGCKRSRDIHITNLIGHPITVCPTQKRGVPILIKEKQARIRWVCSNNPRHPATGAYERFEIFRAGRTVEECFSRGITARDLRQALSNGWIHIDKPEENHAPKFF